MTNSRSFTCTFDTRCTCWCIVLTAT